MSCCIVLHLTLTQVNLKPALVNAVVRKFIIDQFCLNKELITQIFNLVKMVKSFIDI